MSVFLMRKFVVESAYNMFCWLKGKVKEIVLVCFDFSFKIITKASLFSYYLNNKNTNYFKLIIVALILFVL